MADAAYHYETMRTSRLLLVAAALFVLLAVLGVPVLVTIGGVGYVWSALLAAVAFAMVIVAGLHASDAGFYFEHTTRRTFQKVCERKGLTKPDDNRRPIFPRFTELLGTPEAWQARVWPLTGQSMGEFAKAGEAFKSAFRGRTIRFTDNGDGTFMLRVGFLSGEPVTADIPTTDLTPAEGQSWRDVLSRIPVGRYVLGSRQYQMPVIDTQILVAGVTGAGKGSVIWSVLIALLPLIRSGLVRVNGFDPKRNELSLGRQFFARYAASDADMVALLQDLVKRMQARAEGMAGKMRKFVPSLDMPLELIIIDELAYLTSYVTDRKQREAIAKLLSTLLSQGRSSGFVVLAAVQDPRVETVPFRDLFPTRFGMKLPAGMIDIILGPGSREAGAACNEIRRKIDAGMAFVISEESDAPEQVRFNWCSDDLILEAAATLEPPAAA